VNTFPVKIHRSDSCSSGESTCDSHLPSEESVLSLPGSVDSDSEYESLYENASYDQPDLKRIARLICQRHEQSMHTENGVDGDEFYAEKAQLKALVRSFVKEATSGLKCRIFQNQSTSVHIPATLFLDTSLTMTLQHEGKNAVTIPLIDVVEAYSSEDLMEQHPDSQLMYNLRGEEDRSRAVFIKYQAPGFAESWVYVSLADEVSKERCLWSINVLQKFAELEQQRSLEHQRNFA